MKLSKWPVVEFFYPPLRFREKKKDRKRDYSNWRYEKKIVKLDKFKDPYYFLFGLKPIKFFTNKVSKSLCILSDMKKKDGYGNIDQSYCMYYFIPEPVFKSNNNYYLDHLSKLNKSLISWPIKEKQDVQKDKKNISDEKNEI